METKELFERRIAKCNAAYKVALGIDDTVTKLKDIHYDNVAVAELFGDKIKWRRDWKKRIVIVGEHPACFCWGLAIPVQMYDETDIPVDPGIKVKKAFAPTMGEMLEAAFVWAASKQGADYWEGVAANGY